MLIYDQHLCKSPEINYNLLQISITLTEGAFMISFAVKGWKIVGMRGDGTRDGPWADLTRAYFWPAENKKPTHLWTGYFSTQPEEIFLTPKKFRFLGQIVQTQTQTKDAWPNPSNKNLTQPGPITRLNPQP